MSLTVNALRKLQLSGAFPAPAKTDGADTPDKTTDPQSDENKKGAAASSEAVEPESKPPEVDAKEQPASAQDAQASPGEIQLELESPVSTEPDGERPETPLEEDLNVPSHDLASNAMPAQAAPDIGHSKTRHREWSRTERLNVPQASQANQSQGDGTKTPAIDESNAEVPAIDPMLTMPMPTPQPTAESDESNAEVPAIDPMLTMPMPTPQPTAESDESNAEVPAVDPMLTMPMPMPQPTAESDESNAEVPAVDPMLTMPMPTPQPTAESDESNAEVPAVDPMLTMPMPTPQPTAEVTDPAAASSEHSDQLPLDPSITQPLPYKTEKLNAVQTKSSDRASGPIGRESIRQSAGDVPPAPVSEQRDRSTLPLDTSVSSEESDVASPSVAQPVTPQTSASTVEANSYEDDQGNLTPTLQTDIESLQAIVDEAVEGSPSSPSDQNLRPEGEHSGSTPSGITERLAPPSTGSPIPPCVTTETYRLFYDPVIPVVDLDAADSHDTTIDPSSLASAPSPFPGVPASGVGTEPLHLPPNLGDEATGSPPQTTTEVTTAEAGQQNANSVVIPTAFERELIERMSEKDFEKHFQNLHNQLGARSNHQMVGSYLFVAPTLTPRTADVTASLGLLLERFERDVLLIDANLAQQTLTRRFEALNQSGLCDILSGAADPNDVALPTSLRQLRFLPSGDDETGISRVPNRVDMHEIRRLLTAWNDDRRTILCDVGSIDSSIALPMAQAFDGVILVVSMVDLNIDLVHAASQILAEHQVRNVLGCVVTDG